MTAAYEELMGFPWLSSIPEKTLAWLANNVEEVSFDVGDRFIVQGATDRDCYFLLSGQVEVVMDGQVAGRVGPGEVEGEMALLYRRPRGGTTTAVEPVRALTLKASDFDDLASREPDSAQALADSIIARLAERFRWQPPAWQPPESA